MSVFVILDFMRMLQSNHAHLAIIYFHNHILYLVINKNFNLLLVERAII